MLETYGCLMALNATFNNISFISWRSVLLAEETGGPGENHRTLSLNVVQLTLNEIRTLNTSGISVKHHQTNKQA
jgi:hypothetical protein